jgi:hypothetical protein
MDAIQNAIGYFKMRIWIDIRDLSPLKWSSNQSIICLNVEYLAQIYVTDFQEQSDMAAVAV